MSWPLGLSRFIHGFPRFDEPSCAANGPVVAGQLDIERQARLLPAVIATLLDVDSRFGAWPPTCVADLLGRANQTCGSRRASEALLLDGLTELDDGWLRTCDLRFEVLSPALRRRVLGAFARGELGLCADIAQRFVDLLVEVATRAFLDFELGLTPLPGAGHPGVRHA